jgi:excisionase family DNA binding protein
LPVIVAANLASSRSEGGSGMQQRTPEQGLELELRRGVAGTVPAQLHRIPEAMRLLSLSRSVIYEQIRSGRLKSVTQGRRRLIPATAIAEYVDLLLREADDGAA